MFFNRGSLTVQLAECKITTQAQLMTCLRSKIRDISQLYLGLVYGALDLYVHTLSESLPLRGYIF